jgi:tripartite-type tricarboxylate transporter receptor subunit TctC
MTMNRCRRAIGLACLLVFAFGSGMAEAQPYPSDFIRIVVPTPGGSPPDILSRVIASELVASDGWRMVVENRPGAIQTLGIADVLKQPADGYTLLAMSVPTVAAPALLPKLKLQLERELVPVIKVSTGSNVLVVHPSVPARSIAELIALLKKEPDKLNFASGGVGNPAHLIGEMFKLRTRTRATHVPYAQGQQFISDLIAGTTQFSFITTVRVVDLIAAGKLRALAVMGPERIPALRDVPTIVEEGYPDLVSVEWVGFAVKAGTSNEIVAQLNEAISRAIRKPQVREAFARVGQQPAGGTSAEYGELITTELVRWRKLIETAGIKAH